MATLSAGMRLGPYEVVCAIGAGGMGEVYRARDTRIGREVAVKILPSQYSDQKERLARFEQEARNACLLNHPNIIAVHDVGTQNGSPYLVTELLEGETLRQKLLNGPLSPRKASEYATQIAAGLEAAHHKGIVHRDLKPENIFVTRDGRLKILDFGLAKLTQPDHLSQQELSDAPTAWPDSQPGVILGTIGYISPEQVQGKPADNRSDLFAFGAILYEMLTGKRAFRETTSADTLSAILHKEPPAISQEVQTESPALERIMRRCLEKDPEMRFQSARDLDFALEAISGSFGSQAAVQSASPIKTASHNAWKWIAAMILVAAVAGWGSRILQRNEPAKLMQLDVRAPEDRTINDCPLVSPDGFGVAFTATDKNGKSTLWYRSFDSLNAQELQGTEHASLPFWSADGRYLGFFADGKLRKVALSGGPSQEIADAPDPRGGAWNSQDTIIFAPYPGDGLYRVNSTGGARTPITSLDRTSGESTHRWPSFLPDGVHFVFFCWSQGEKQKTGVYLGSLNAKETRFLFSSDTSAIYASPGYLLFNQENNLMVRPFEADKLQLTGEAIPLLEKAWYNGDMAGRSGDTVSSNGVLTLIPGSILKDFRWFDRNGNFLGSLREPADYQEKPAISPDAKRIALTLSVPPGSNGGSIWLYDTTTSNIFRFTLSLYSNYIPVWSPDGSKILFAYNPNGPYNLYVRDTNGTGSEQLLLKSDNWLLPNDWTAHPEAIVYEEVDPKTKHDLWVLPLSGDRKPQPFLNTPANEAQGQVSPDGNWIAYCSDESGQPEIYVQSFLKKTEGKWQVSVNGGTTPKWRKDGEELFYLTSDGKVMSVEVKSGASFTFGAPKMLFRTPPLVAVPWASAFSDEYEPSPDGQKFLIRTPLSNSEFRSITVIFNWSALLEKKK
ncbi:MAG: hypothetical protein C5B54_06815 [Acidobacteria bacterium]|nr:MAG: hypothetical protein C5B54_06815 [Acidobacteriota bacterium]